MAQNQENNKNNRNNKKPEIRFNGFDDEWEEKKLGEIAKETYGGGTPKTSEKEFWGGNIPWIQSSDLIDGKVSGVNINKKISKDGLLKSATKLVPENSIAVITRVGVGKLALMPFQYTTSQDFLSLSNLISEPWFTIYTLYRKLQSELNIVQGTSIKGITKEDLLSKDLLIPTGITEQAKIGSFFKCLDGLINLHQSKCDKLSVVKKSLLDKMFPKNGETVPEIRFRGFEDEWEEKKLGEIADVRDGTHDSPQYYPTGHPFVTSKNIKDGYINYDNVQYISYEDFSKINIRSKVDKNDILMGMIGTIGNIALVRENPDFAIKNIALIKDTKSIYYLFLFYHLQATSVLQQLEEGMDGGTQKFVALNKIRAINIDSPVNNEQAKIGSFFKCLDSLISLEQSRLEKLKTIKKSLLDKMFV